MTHIDLERASATIRVSCRMLWNGPWACCVTGLFFPFSFSLFDVAPQAPSSFLSISLSLYSHICYLFFVPSSSFIFNNETRIAIHALIYQNDDGPISPLQDSGWRVSCGTATITNGVAVSTAHPSRALLFKRRASSWKQKGRDNAELTLLYADAFGRKEEQ